MNIDFFFDFGSPYAYLANTQLPALAKRTGASFTRRPMLLGAVFKATGNQMPALIPAKANYFAQDLPRLAAIFSVPMQWPHHFPLRTMALLRAAAAVRAQAPAAYESFVDLAFAACWADRRDPTASEVLTSVAEAAGVPTSLVVEANNSPAAKDALRADTDAAIAAGVFGAPTLLLGTELFFGVESLPFLEERLRRHSPLASFGNFPGITLA